MAGIADGILTHLKLCLGDAIYNLKWVKIIQIGLCTHNKYFHWNCVCIGILKVRDPSQT